MTNDDETTTGWGGQPERTDATVAKAVYKSLARGTMTRFLEPGDRVDAPADRVEVVALGGDDDRDVAVAEYDDPEGVGETEASE